MNKASMILEICSSLDINYLSSMHNMSLKDLSILYNALYKHGIELKEIKSVLRNLGDES